MRKILAILACLLPSCVDAQVPNFPQTLPANTVVGRLGIGPGPSQAIPFSLLTSNLLSSLCTTAGAFPVFESGIWQCSTVTNSAAIINGTLSLTVTNPVLTFLNTSFASPSGASNVRANQAIYTTWQTGIATGGLAIAAQSIITATAPNDSIGAVFGGTLNQSENGDPYGVLGVMNNVSTLTNRRGAAIWGITRGAATGTAALFVDALRATSEGSDSPAHGLYIYNSTATNAFTNGVHVASAVSYGFRVGVTVAEGAGFASVITPTHPYSYYNTSGVEVYYVDNGAVVNGYGLKIFGASSGSLTFAVPAAAGSNTITFPAGTTNFSATGGTSQVVKQTSSGGAFTVGTVAGADISGGGTNTILFSASGTAAWSATPAINTSLAVPIIGPLSDSTTALRLTKANLSTAVVTVDTTNSRVGINKTPGTVDLDVNGAGTFGGALTGTAVYATADPGGEASTNSLSNGSSTTISTGVGSVKMSTTNSANNAAWIKMYVGTTAYWVPGWTTNAP